MRAARIMDDSAARAAGFGGSPLRRRRKPPREVALARAVAPVVAEVLEGRRLLTVTATIDSSGDNPVLLVTGDGLNNSIVVYQENYSPTQKVSVLADGSRYGPWLVTEFTRIKVLGENGNDTVTIETDDSNPEGDFGVNFPADLYGGYGNDTLNGGDYADKMYGGDGGDSLDGHAAADYMYGGDGADFFHDDDMTGGDQMFGEAGNDTFDSADFSSTADVLDGGAGTDDASSHSTNDTVINCEV